MPKKNAASSVPSLTPACSADVAATATRTPTSGCVTASRATTSGRNAAAMVSMPPTSSVWHATPPAASTASRAASARSISRSAKPSRHAPAAVRASLRFDRSNSATPRSASSACICSVTLDCVRWIWRAASLRFRVRATRMKVFRRFRSMAFGRLTEDRLYPFV
jgi:hypothetical protein